MNLGLDVMSERQKQVLRKIGPTAAEWGFYLAGGTALALRLGHRRSEDFDWFTGEGFADPGALAHDLRGKDVPFSVSGIARKTLHGTVSHVRVSFFGYDYPLLGAPVPLPEYGCETACLDDLACMKLAAVAQRGSKRDFVDVYAILRNEAPLEQVLALYRRKYGVQDIGHVLAGLSYFDEAEGEVMPEMIWEVDWPTVKSGIQGCVRKAVG